jgi:hypothetical protein
MAITQPRFGIFGRRYGSFANKTADPDSGNSPYLRFLLFIG